MYLEKFSLDGAVGIVTGGGQGLGRVYCHALAEAGADIVVAEINRESGGETAEQVRAMGRRSISVETDVRQRASVDRMVERTLADFGQIDFLINNAARAQVGPSADVGEDEWRDILELNLDSVFSCCQAVGRHMIERRSGSIVNIASISGHVLNRGRSHASYNVSKAGVIHLTKALACEWAEHNIRVNAISPGYMATEQAKRALADPTYGPQVIPWIPMQRPGEPEELGALAIFLVSAASSYMTGAAVVIDGGYTCW